MKMTTFGWPNSSIHPYNHPSIHSEEGKRKAGGLVIFVFFPFFLLLLSELIGTWAKRTHFFYFFFFRDASRREGTSRGHTKADKRNSPICRRLSDWSICARSFPFFFFFVSLFFPLIPSYPASHPSNLHSGASFPPPCI